MNRLETKPRRPVGRPRLTAERRHQIVDAFVACVAEQGLAGASITATAQALGLDRSTLHHYFRTREELIEAAVRRVIARYREPLEERLRDVEPGERLAALLEHAFSPGFDDEELSSVLLAFSAAAPSDPGALEALREIYGALEEAVEAELERSDPQARRDERRELALAIVQLVEGAATFRELGFGPDHTRAARRAADALLGRLRSDRDGPAGY